MVRMFQTKQQQLTTDKTRNNHKNWKLKFSKQSEMNDLINQLQDTIFNARETINDKTYKDTLELIGKLHNLNEEKSFENECKRYKVAFIRNQPDVVLPLENKELCEYDMDGDCCKGVLVDIRSNTFIRKLVLHPLLVEYLEDEVYLQEEHCPSRLTHFGSVFSKPWLEHFLEKIEKKDMLDKLCSQYETKILPILRDTPCSRVTTKTTCGGTEEGDKDMGVRRYYQLQNRIILFKIKEI